MTDISKEGQPESGDGTPAGKADKISKPEEEISAHRPFKKEGEFGDCLPEFLTMLKQLLDIYKPKQRLRKEGRDLAKAILSLKQGFDGNKCRCVVCEREDGVLAMDIHHYDGIESHNEIINLGPAHHTCNASLNGKVREELRRRLLQGSRLGSVNVSERTKQASTPAKKSTERDITEEARNWSSKEGVKHDTQRYAWNRWITDLEVGPFRGINTQLLKSALSKMAPWGLGTYLGMDGPLGSSVTYRRFIEEDIAGGILGQDENEFGKAVVYLLYSPKTEPVK